MSEARERIVACTREFKRNDRIRDWRAEDGEVFEGGSWSARTRSGASRMRMAVEDVSEARADSIAAWTPLSSVLLSSACA